MDAETGRRRASAVGAWALLLTGAGHLAISAVLAAGPVPAGRRAARESMTDTHLAVLGLDRTLAQLFTGFSLTMAILAIGLGGLNLLVLRHTPQVFLAGRGVLWLDLAVSVTTLGMSVLFFPPPPIVLLGIATLAFGYALTRPSVPAAAGTPATAPATAPAA